MRRRGECVTCRLENNSRHGLIQSTKSARYQGHHSVLEHAWWSFLLTGVTRAFTHQLVRHKVGFAYSQLSQQYHDESGARTVMPDVIRQRPHLAAIWERAVEQTHEAYVELLNALARETLSVSDREGLRLIRSAARTVLPAATETKIAFTANARALRHFLRERGAIAGDEEMRGVSVLLLESVSKDAPGLFADFAVADVAGGVGVIAKSG